MASSLITLKKTMKRTESRKSHSWWWDSHISPKNSKWLAENLEEMDQSVKRMLRLIEEEGDSFAKKAEMYYQKRPELISHVEEFYRMYRSLAERYDHLTGELRKNIPSDLQSQHSGVSDLGSEPVSTCPSPDQRSRFASSHRAAGFEYFLGSGGSISDAYAKEGDESSSSLDSESESDESSVNNYSGPLGNNGDQGPRTRIIELEAELRDVKEKLRQRDTENTNCSLKGTESENAENMLARIACYEEEMTVARERIRLSEEEIACLKIKLQQYGSLEFTEKNLQSELESAQKEAKMSDAELVSEVQEKISGLEAHVSDPDQKIQTLEEELRITKEQLDASEKETAILTRELEGNNSSERIRQLQDQVELARKDISMWKAKFEAEKREVSKLQERVGRYKTNLLERDREIRELNVAISDGNPDLSLEKSQLQAENSKLLEERSRLEEKLKELEIRVCCLEETIKRAEAGKKETEDQHGGSVRKLNSEIEQLKADIAERNDGLTALKSKIDMLVRERDELNAEVGSRNDEMNEMVIDLKQLRMEHEELISGSQRAGEQVEVLQLRVKELEEEKRAAIRQLCFSLEHYKNAYNRLRRAFIVHKAKGILKPVY